METPTANRYLPEWIKKLLPESISTVDWTPVWLHGFVALLVYSALNGSASVLEEFTGIALPWVLPAALTVALGFGRELLTGWQKNQILNPAKWSLRKNAEWLIFAAVAVIMEIQV